MSTKGILYGDYLRFLNALAIRHKRRFLAVELAARMNEDGFGVLSYMIRNASNLAMIIELLRKYLALVSPGAEIVLQEEDWRGIECYVLRYEHPGFNPKQSHQDVEGTIAQLVTLFRKVLNDTSWLAPRICFQHSASSPSDAEQYPFSHTIHFQQPISGLYFEKSLMDKPVDSADPHLLNILESSAVEALGSCTSSSLLHSLRALLTSAVPQQALDVNSIACELGVSRRTLSRRLKEQGTSFSEVKELVLMQLACKSLQHSGRPISLIAQTLSYSDASAFNRAFRRVHSCTPSQYRQKAQKKH